MKFRLGHAEFDLLTEDARERIRSWLTDRDVALRDVKALVIDTDDRSVTHAVLYQSDEHGHRFTVGREAATEGRTMYGLLPLPDTLNRHIDAARTLDESVPLTPAHCPACSGVRMVPCPLSGSV